MICDSELLKLTNGEQTYHVTADIVYAGNRADSLHIFLFVLNILGSLTILYDFFPINANGTILIVTVLVLIMHLFIGLVLVLFLCFYICSPFSFPVRFD